MKKITTDDLEQLFRLLIARLKSLDINELHLDDNWYWKVDENEKFNLETIPQNINVGSYFDDIERINKILKDENLLLTDLSTISNILSLIEVFALSEGFD